MKDHTQPHHTVPVHGSVLSRFLFVCFFGGGGEGGQGTPFCSFYLFVDGMGSSNRPIRRTTGINTLECISCADSLPLFNGC